MKLTDRVREFLDEKSKELALRFFDSILGRLEEYEFIEKEISSPIEQLFYIEWVFRKFSDHDLELELIPQYQDKSTGKYRIDFAIDFIQEIYRWNVGLNIENEILKIPIPKLGIEIDGHIWHEKTKEQVQHHKERERHLISKDWKLLRFTGSEIFKNPSNCVDEVLEVAEKMQIEYHQKIKEKIYG